MSLSGITSPISSGLYPTGLTGTPSLATSSAAAMNPLGAMGITGGLGAGLGTGSTLGGSALGGSPSEALTQLLSMVMMLLQALLPQLMSLLGGQQSPVTSQTLAAQGPPSDWSPSNTGTHWGSPQGTSSDSPESSGGTGNAGGSSNPPATGGNNNGSSAGWNKNVSIMTSSDAQHETTDMYSGGQLVGGYLHDLEDGMDQGMNIDQANAQAQGKNTEGATSANVNPNSLVKGKGGNALIVTGDNYGNDQDADQLADKLKKDYGMNVKVIKNASPNQVKQALQEMGQQGGQQAMVAVLAHGAHDDSGQNKGMMAMGKGDGDQWLSEDALKSEVNQYLSPSYGNVNVLLNSCYSGNFAS